MILTITLNSALDVTYRLAAVRWHGANRVKEVRRRAGGKGINVARVLHALGRDAVVTGFAGGPTGEQVRADLAAAGLHEQLIPIAPPRPRGGVELDRVMSELQVGLLQRRAVRVTLADGGDVLSDLPSCATSPSCSGRSPHPTAWRDASDEFDVPLSGWLLTRSSRTYHRQRSFS
jgi:hypothetical protein